MTILLSKSTLICADSIAVSWYSFRASFSLKPLPCCRFWAAKVGEPQRFNEFWRVKINVDVGNVFDVIYSGLKSIFGRKRERQCPKCPPSKPPIRSTSAPLNALLSELLCSTGKRRLVTRSGFSLRQSPYSRFIRDLQNASWSLYNTEDILLGMSNK